MPALSFLPYLEDIIDLEHLWAAANQIWASGVEHSKTYAIVTLCRRWSTFWCVPIMKFYVLLPSDTSKDKPAAQRSNVATGGSGSRDATSCKDATSSIENSKDNSVAQRSNFEPTTVDRSKQAPLIPPTENIVQYV